MRTALSTCAARGGDCAGPNRLGVCRAKVDAGLGACIVPSTTLLVDFDRRHAADCRQSLVNVGGQPDLVLSRRFPRGLCARIGSRWITLSGSDLCDMTVVGRVVKINQAAV